MSESQIKHCDNLSVGVILTNAEGDYALLERRRPPVGIAPVAGHIDEHGSPWEAAIAETGEEVGVTIALDGLAKTVIEARRVDNVCRRPGGDHHVWTVYEAQVDSGELRPDPDETRGAEWYPRLEMQALADRTRLYLAGGVSEADWLARPGIEPVWVAFLAELGYID